MPPRVQERSKGLLVLALGAAVAGVVMEVRRHGQPSATPALASASAAAPVSSAIAPRRPATDAELVEGIALLESSVRTAAGDPTSPWALAHGLVAFGPEFRATDDRLAVDVIGTFVERRRVGDRELWLFPERRQGALVEPHRHLLVKTLLELELPATRRFALGDGASVTLGELVLGVRQAMTLPSGDADWHHAAWALSALASADAAGLADSASATTRGLATRELAARALERLEADHAVVASFDGPVERAFAPGSPLREAKANKSGIFGHSCGGLHLVQAVLTAFATAPESERKRVARQLGVLIYRYESERLTLTELLRAHPAQGLLLRVQQLKFFGHWVETVTLARQLGYLQPGAEGTKRLEGLTLEAAADVVAVARELHAGGVYQRLPQVRAEREQTYLDLVGDACHAIRGLRRARALTGAP